MYRIAVDPVFPPPPIPNSKKHQIPDAMDNKYELVFNERDDAAEPKNLPIDDTMHGIIEEEELEEAEAEFDEEEPEIAEPAPKRRKGAQAAVAPVVAERFTGFLESKGKKGKGKGGRGSQRSKKGKGKGKQKKGEAGAVPAAKFQGYCNFCGKYGHKAVACRSRLY